MKSTLTVLWMLLLLTNIQSQIFSISNNGLKKTTNALTMYEKILMLNAQKKPQTRGNELVKLDSFLFYNSSFIDYRKNVFEYDENKNNLMSSFQKENFAYELHFQSKKTYYENGLIKEIIYLNNTAGVVKPSGKNFLTYFPNGQIKTIDYYAYFDFAWDLLSREMYLYDERNRIKNITYYHEITPVIYDKRVEYIYSDTLDVRFTYKLNFETQNIESIVKSETKKTANKSSTTEYFYSENETWIELSKVDSVFDVNSNTMSIYDYKNKVNEDWVVQNIDILRRNQQGNLIALRQEIYNQDAVLTELNLDTFIFVSDYLLEHIYSSYNTSERIWVPKSKTTLEYDSLISNDMVIYPFDPFQFVQEDIEIYFQKKLNHLNHYDYVENNWELINYIEHYYSPSVLNTTLDHATAHCSIYPNPTNQFIRFNPGGETIVQLSIYDGRGSLVKTECENFEEIDVSDLPVGSYYFEAKMISNQLETGSFLIVK